MTGMLQGLQLVGKFFETHLVGSHIIIITKTCCCVGLIRVYFWSCFSIGTLREVRVFLWKRFLIVMHVELCVEVVVLHI